MKHCNLMILIVLLCLASELLADSNDVVSYASLRSNKGYIAQLKKKYSGLSNERQLDDLLDNQNYIEVLNHLWSEPQQAKRVQWLENKAQEGHPILMFELGAEYQLQDPSLNTYITQTLPWITAGARRTSLDASCTTYDKAKAAESVLLSIYKDPIDRELIEKHTKAGVEKYCMENTHFMMMRVVAKLRTVMQPFVSDNQDSQPSPAWVFAYDGGLDQYSQNVISPFQWNSIREKKAQDILLAFIPIDSTLDMVNSNLLRP